MSPFSSAVEIEVARSVLDGSIFSISKLLSAMRFQVLLLLVLFYIKQNVQIYLVLWSELELMPGDVDSCKVSMQRCINLFHRFQKFLVIYAAVGVDLCSLSPVMPFFLICSDDLLKFLHLCTLIL